MYNIVRKVFEGRKYKNFAVKAPHMLGLPTINCHNKYRMFTQWCLC